MNVTGAELLKEPPGTLKFILNDTGIAFFTAVQQHRDVKMPGLSYEDDYRGNAVAGLITQERVEIRFHNAFTDERIRALWSLVLMSPEIVNTRPRQLYYQGREIT